MKYQITQQFIRDEEKAIAEFHEQADAEQFIVGKSKLDQDQSMTLIYRLYIKQRLACEYNKDQIKTPISEARFAENIHELPYVLDYRYKVRLSQPSPMTLATFNTQNDAELFLQSKCQTDSVHNYQLFDHKTLIDTWQADCVSAESGSNTSSNAISFSPTPLNMKPFPPGTPPPWVKDVEEDDEAQ